MKKFLKFLFSIAIVIALFVTAAMTCPSRNKHIEVLSDRISYAYTGIDPSESSGLDKLGGQLGKGVAKLFLKTQLTVDNCLFFSLGRIDDQIVSVGLFGYIFSAPRELLRQEVKAQFSN